MSRGEGASQLRALAATVGGLYGAQLEDIAGAIPVVASVTRDAVVARMRRVAGLLRIAASPAADAYELAVEIVAGVRS